MKTYEKFIIDESEPYGEENPPMRPHIEDYIGVEEITLHFGEADDDVIANLFEAINGVGGVKEVNQGMEKGQLDIIFMDPAEIELLEELAGAMSYVGFSSDMIFRMEADMPEVEAGL